MKHGIHEIAGAVSSERPACPVCTVCSGREAQDQNECMWIAKAGHRARPVLLVLIGTPTGFPDAGTVCPQPGATLTSDDRAANPLVITLVIIGRVGRQNVQSRSRSGSFHKREGGMQ